MYILVACEESQRVCIELRKLGHVAYSCDIQVCSGGHPEWHISGDCIPLLNGFCSFKTQDGVLHSINSKWDMIIAHPPCTRLCSTGQRWLYYGSDEYQTKKKKEQELAISFFFKFVHADCEKIAIENPVGIMSRLYRKPDQIYNPYDFEGETECKRTCLWLKNLQPLKPTQVLSKESRTHNIYQSKTLSGSISWNSPECAKMRSKTPIGVARAMAIQWLSEV
ncbi:MAG: hypothetical protein UD936_10000 [Acutalibacteraceae bacterium]|nr:hypothetical protein [Acutalibacteraceae bacterium]